MRKFHFDADNLVDLFMSIVLVCVALSLIGVTALALHRIWLEIF